MFRKALFATAATILLSIPAMAADVVVEEPVVVSSWTGFYIGGGVGAAWSDFDTGGKFCREFEIDDVRETECFKASDIPDFDFDTPFFGGNRFGNLFGDESDTTFRGIVQAGFDWELAPGFVIGVMGDYNFGQTTGNSVKDVELFDFDNLIDVEVTDKFSYGIDNMWTLSGRLGWGTEQALFYGLLGYTWADAEAKLQVGCVSGDCFISEKNSNTLNGPTFGAGVEFKGLFWDGASTRLEYRYTNLDSTNLKRFREFDGELDTVGGEWNADIDQNVQGVYLTFNWRFDTM